MIIIYIDYNLLLFYLTDYTLWHETWKKLQDFALNGNSNLFANCAFISDC